MIKHLGREISPILIVIWVFPLLGFKGVLPSNNLLSRRKWSVSCWCVIGLSHSHLLNSFIVVVIFIFKCEFRVLFHPIWYFSWLQIYYIKLAMLFVVNFSLIKGKTIISIVWQLRIRWIKINITFLSRIVLHLRLL